MNTNKRGDYGEHWSAYAPELTTIAAIASLWIVIGIAWAVGH